jgi:UDP-N-acetyl-2-amino-2-deoxyglucuronate dehydrogenase
MAMDVGLIGSGNITETHARAVRAIPGVELAAIWRTNVANVACLCQRYGGTAYENFEDLLRHRRLDFVIIRSPSGHGIAAEHHGLHVLSEKPVDISSQRADALIRAAEQSGLNLGVIFQDRLKPGLRQLRGSIPKAGAGQDDAGGRAREVVPAPEILRPFAMTRDLCA